MSPDSWARLLKRGVRWAVIVPAVGSLVGAWPSMQIEYAQASPVGRVALLGLGILQVVVIGLVLRAVRSAWLEAAVVLVTSALLIAFVGGRPMSAGPIGWWPTSAVVIVQCWVLAFGSRRRWCIGTVGVLLFAGIRLWASLRTGAQWVGSVGDVVVATQLPLTAVLGLAAVHRVTSRNDRAERERAQAAADEVARGAGAARAREVGRFLHDDLSHTLRAISGARHLEPVAVRRLARLSADRLQSGNLTPMEDGVEADLLDRLNGLADVTGVRVRLSGRAPVLTQDVAQAITAAATEALRNVRRHSGTEEATIRVRSSRAGVVVSIIDHGCGLPRDARWGVGIAHSMVGRMAEVGGTAAVYARRSGTVVELSWSPNAVTERLAGTWRELTRAMTPMVIPGLVGTSIIGLVVLDDLDKPLLALMSLLAFAACGALAVRGICFAPVRAYALLVGTAVSCFAANVFAVHADTVNGYHLFMAGGAACLLMLVAIQHSLVWSLLALAAVWGAMVGLGMLRFGPETLTVNLFGVLTAPFVVLGVLLPRAVLSRLVRRTLAAREQTFRSMLRAQDLVDRHGAEDARLRRTRQRVLPYLHAVADGRLDLDDPAALRQAIRLEAMVRDELRFGGTEDALAEAIDRVRRDGWSVEIRVRPEDRGAVVDRAAVLLDALGEKDEPTGTAFLSAFGEVTLVVRNPSPDKLKEWRARPDIDVEEGDQWCRLINRTNARNVLQPPTRSQRPVKPLISLEPGWRRPSGSPQSTTTV